jgi:hypothetical protein
LTIPHRGATSESTYFVTANVFEKKSLFRVNKVARLFAEIGLDYRVQKKYRKKYPYSSANPSFKLDPVPQWLKPVSSTA